MRSIEPGPLGIAHTVAKAALLEVKAIMNTFLHTLIKPSLIRVTGICGDDYLSLLPGHVSAAAGLSEAPAAPQRACNTLIINTP